VRASTSDLVATVASFSVTAVPISCTLERRVASDALVPSLSNRKPLAIILCSGTPLARLVSFVMVFSLWVGLLRAEQGQRGFKLLLHLLQGDRISGFLGVVRGRTLG